MLQTLLLFLLGVWVEWLYCVRCGYRPKAVLIDASIRLVPPHKTSSNHAGNTDCFNSEFRNLCGRGESWFHRSLLEKKTVAPPKIFQRCNRHLHPPHEYDPFRLLLPSSSDFRQTRAKFLMLSNKARHTHHASFTFHDNRKASRHISSDTFKSNFQHTPKTMAYNSIDQFHIAASHISTQQRWPFAFSFQQTHRHFSNVAMRAAISLRNPTQLRISIYEPQTEWKGLKTVRSAIPRSGNSDLDDANEDESDDDEEKEASQSDMGNFNDLSESRPFDSTFAASSKQNIDAFSHLERNQSDFAFVFGNGKSPFAHRSMLNVPKNHYFESVVKLAPNELIAQFVQSAPRRVQDAAKSTVLSLLGTLPKFSLETTILTTGEKLANLMFQLQITGYMFKNAEYRLSLTDCLKFVASPAVSWNKNQSTLLPSSTTGTAMVENATATSPTFLQYFQSLVGENKDSATSHSSGGALSELLGLNITGKLFVRLDDGRSIETDAAELVSTLRWKITELQEELEKLAIHRAKEKEHDLLGYIKALSEAQMRSLTENISGDVIDAMRMLTSIVIEGLGAGREFGNDAITQQTGSVIAQLSMWQLAIGYNFREMEIREDMRRSFENFSKT